MKAPGYTSLIIVLLAGTLAGMATAQKTVAGRRHVLLLDASASMRPKYNGNLKGWLIEPLLNAGAFAPTDHVIVRWFHQRGNTDFDPNDPLRKYNGLHNPRAVADAMPTAAQANGLNTDLPEALDLALADLRNLKTSDDVLLWMVTDNDQDASGTRDADAFYQKISGDKNFHAAYLFPLTKENGRQLSSNDSALVMYLLHYSTRSSPPDVDSIADNVGRRIGNDPITWIPVSGRLNLDESNITVNSQPAQIVDGKLALPSVKEGAAPEFNIQFKFNSRLRGREIEQGKIAPEGVTASLPASIEARGDLTSWRATVSPPTIRIKPRQQSSTTYTATLSAPAVTLHPSGFWDAVWNSESEPVDASLKIALSDTKTKLDVAALSQVKNLSNIQNIIQRSQNNPRPIVIPIRFSVAYNTFWRRAVAALLCVLLLAGIGGCASLLLIKNRYTLSAGGEERLMTLPLIAKSRIPIGGENAAVITRRFGKLRVAPLGLYQINGGNQPVRLKDNDSFLIHDEAGENKYPHEISKRGRAAPVGVERDPFYE